VHTLKIDQAFVRDMLEDPEDLGIVDSVVRLAQVFNRPVIAEGVETIEHGAMLVQLGCYLGQGYGIARPMPAEQLPAWAASWHGQGLWQELGAVTMPKDSLPLLVAAASHRKWVDSVVAYVGAEGKDLPRPRTGNECRFGRWYGGSGSASYGHLPQYRTLAPLHERMHRMAVELVALVDQDSSAAARAGLPALLVLSDALAAGLARLRHDADRGGEH
jgi:hypothetical protein